MAPHLALARLSVAGSLPTTPVWKQQLLAGHVDPATVAAVGHAIGVLHGASAHRADLAAAFDTGTPISHWLTPETEITTHYFWAQARDRFVGNDEMSAQIVAGIDGAFRNDDEPMIEACQQNLGTADLMSLKPLLLQTDGPAARARRVIQMKLESSGP